MPSGEAPLRSAHFDVEEDARTIGYAFNQNPETRLLVWLKTSSQAASIQCSFASIA